MFYDRLRDLRTAKGLSQEELGNIIGVSKSTIGMYEQGKRMPKTDTIMKQIAKYFDVSIDYLVGLSSDKFPSPSITNDYVTFPVVGDIAAGYDNIAVEGWDGDTIEVPTSYLKGRDKKDFFVLRVKGDSMYPLYHENDKVLILKQTTLNNSGDIGAVLYDDEIATLKKVEYVEGENWFRLIPINPNIPPKIIEGERLEHCRILGIPKLIIREV